MWTLHAMTLFRGHKVEHAKATNGGIEIQPNESNYIDRCVLHNAFPCISINSLVSGFKSSGFFNGAMYSPLHYPLQSNKKIHCI